MHTAAANLETLGGPKFRLMLDGIAATLRLCMDAFPEWQTLFRASVAVRDAHTNLDQILQVGRFLLNVLHTFHARTRNPETKC